MDKYLDSLIRKNEEVEVTDDVEEAVEVEEVEVADNAEEVIEEVEIAEEGVEEDPEVDVEVSEESVLEESIDQEIGVHEEDNFQMDYIPDITTDTAVIPDEPELSSLEPEESSMGGASFVEGELRTVEGIIIYNTPDTRSLAKVFNGNIVLKGVFNDMVEVEYMKPGIGLVKGFIQKAAL